MRSKKALRKWYKQERANLGEVKLADLSAAIIKRSILFLQQHPEFRHIHIFLPIQHQNEVDTVPLLHWIYENGRQVYTSVVQWDAEELKTVKIMPGEVLVKDRLGILIPKNAQFVEDQEVDLVIVPLLVADENGNRLGYGKGFYDKFLTKLDARVFKLGLSFFPLEKSIPAESHDVPLDGCVFPNDEIVFNK